MGHGVHRRSAARPALAGASAICALGVAACGSGGGFASPLAAVRGFQTAINHHDASGACDDITDSFRNAMVPGKVGIYSWKSCDELAHLTFTHNAGVLLREAQIDSSTASGSSATVAIRMKLNIDDTPQPAQVKLVRQGGGWRIDDLCASGACFKQAFIIRRNRRSSS